MSFLRDDENNNDLQLPVALANAIKSAAVAGISAEGDSPPPSRPAPHYINIKRRRQFKSTENVSRNNNVNSDIMESPDKVH